MAQRISASPLLRPQGCTTILYKVQIGDIVVIQEDVSSTMLWQLGRVLQTFPGRNGVVWWCLLCVSSGQEIRHPIQHLYLLEASHKVHHNRWRGRVLLMIVNKEARTSPVHAGKCASAARAENEMAYATARALHNRAPATNRPALFGGKDRMTDCSEITKTYCLARRVLPPPRPGLSRAEAVLLRQLQTELLPTHALMHRMYPEKCTRPTCARSAIGRRPT